MDLGSPKVKPKMEQVSFLKEPLATFFSGCGEQHVTREVCRIYHDADCRVCEKDRESKRNHDKGRDCDCKIDRIHPKRRIGIVIAPQVVTVAGTSSMASLMSLVIP